MHKDAKKALGAAKQYTDEAIAESGGTKDYEKLTNKPGINGVELSGNKTAAQLSLASLVDGKVPAAQLPSYVDDVIEGYLHEGHFYEDDQYTTEITGEAGKIYVDLASSRSYRWSGSAFVRVDDVDLTNYVQKSQTAGLLKNDGTIDTDTFVKTSSTAGLLKNDGTVDTTAYAKQNEMSVTDGTGADADKTTIQLKSGTSATVLKSHQSISGKTDKVSGATSGNFAALDSNGNLTDSGHKHSDYLTQHQSISGKADKVANATNGNFAALDSNGNLTDSGHKHSDYLTQHQDISGKADKLTSSANGHLASFDADGNLADSGKATTNAVTQNSTALVESGAVYTAINTAIGNAVDNLLAASY